MCDRTLEDSGVILSSPSGRRGDRGQKGVYFSYTREVTSRAPPLGPQESAMNLISDPSSSVLESGVVPGAPITAVAYAQHPGQFALFFTDPHGEVYTILENATTGWGPWSSVSQGSTTPGAPITAVASAPQTGRVALFVADRGGEVYTNSGSAATGWDGWSSVSQGSTTPGAPITAVAYAQQPGRFALFVADRGGEVYTNSGNAATGWDGWSSVSQGSTTPGAPITAVAYAQQPGRFALFVADRGGEVYTNSGSAATGWDGWSSVSQ